MRPGPLSARKGSPRRIELRSTPCRPPRRRVLSWSQGQQAFFPLVRGKLRGSGMPKHAPMSRGRKMLKAKQPRDLPLTRCQSCPREAMPGWPPCAFWQDYLTGRRHFCRGIYEIPARFLCILLSQFLCVMSGGEGQAGPFFSEEAVPVRFHAAPPPPPGGNGGEGAMQFVLLADGHWIAWYTKAWKQFLYLRNACMCQGGQGSEK